MFFILNLFFLLSCIMGCVRATMSRRGRVTLSSQPCLHVIFSKDFFSVGQRSWWLRALQHHFSSLCFFSFSHIWKSCTVVCISCMFFFPQQAITAISAPGEMIALWIKFGGKTAPHVASESAIKQEWCSEVLADWISCCWVLKHI